MPVILVGNKCDEEDGRKVKTELAQDYVSKVFKKCGFIETSAKTNHNVQEAFQVRWCTLSFSLITILHCSHLHCQSYPPTPTLLAHANTLKIISN